MRDELLRCTVHLGVPDAQYDLPYNTVSGELMRRLVGLIRERYLGEPAAPPLEVEPADTAELSFYFERLLRDEQESGSGMQPVAAQADTAMGTLEECALRGFLFGILDKRLLESLHLSDGRELRVVDRGQDTPGEPARCRRSPWPSMGSAPAGGGEDARSRSASGLVRGVRLRPRERG